MRRVFVGDQSFVTGDDIAASIVKYSEVLKRHGQTAQVKVPAVTRHGGREMIALVLGLYPAGIQPVGEEDAEPTNRDHPRSSATIDASFDPGYDL
jgi:hypothetical protein